MSLKEFTNQTIICFAGEDWWFHNPHSNSHIMQSFAKNNRVLFVNSTGIKMPAFNSGGFFWKRACNKLASLLRYLKKAQRNIWVLTPFAIPLIRGHEKFVARLNKFLLIVQLHIAISFLRFSHPIIWVTSPAARDISLYLKQRFNTALVYYCCDNLSLFPGVDHDYIFNMEKDIQSAADLSLFVSSKLAYERKDFGKNIQLLSHGVDYEHFALAQESHWPVPDDVRQLPRPIFGYVGEIKPLDFQLVSYLAGEHAQCSFVFIGDIYAQLKELNLPRNVYFLGKKPYAQLPDYMQLFDVCCLYYNLQDTFNNYRNPKKLMEYFATGKPVVSVDIMQIRDFIDSVYIAKNYAEFSHLLTKALSSDTAQARQQRIKIAQEHTWDAVARRAGSLIVTALEV